MRPLENITVLSLEQAIAAPFCTRQLADLGARVIKVERPGSGDFARSYDRRVRGLSSHFVWVNRSKESLTLDLKHSEAATILTKLLDKTDVFVQNLLPGAVNRLGLSPQTLREKHPRLIICGISGYGVDGPYGDRKAYDLLIQSEAGFLSSTGSANQPAKAGCSIADIAAGMYAYSNILAALIQLSKTGKGSTIDISLLESMLEWMGHPLYYAFEGEPFPRTGADHATIYPYGSFPIGEGSTIMLAVQNQREWAEFCGKVLQQPGLAEDPRFASNMCRSSARQELRSIIVEVFSRLSWNEVVDRLEVAKIAYSRMNDMREVWRHEQLKARRRWVEIDTSGGRIPAMLPPGLPGICAPRMDSVPDLGEHTESILKELGYDDDAIARLREKNII